MAQILKCPGCGSTRFNPVESDSRLPLVYCTNCKLVLCSEGVIKDTGVKGFALMRK